jgi:hypothetical protein
MNGISLSELARRIGRDKGQLSRMAKAGRIPRQPDGSFDEAVVRQVLKRTLDPARSKPLAGGQRLTLESTPPAHGPAILFTCDDHLQPRPKDYRLRADIGDLFLRGVFFGLHRMAFDIPVQATEAALSAGASAQMAYAMRDLMREAICGLISDVCAETGILTPGSHDPYFIPDHLVPPALYDISPRRLAILAKEPLDLSAWQAWERQVQEAAI